MKTPMKRTVFKVILRKSEYKEQWSLLIESFLSLSLARISLYANMNHLDGL